MGIAWHQCSKIGSWRHEPKAQQLAVGSGQLAVGNRQSTGSCGLAVFLRASVSLPAGRQVCGKKNKI